MNYPDLRGLLVCREFLSDPVLLIMGEYVLSSDNVNKRNAAAAALLAAAERLGLSGNVWRQYLLYLLCRGNNIAATAIEDCGSYGSGLLRALQKDMHLLRPYLQAKPSDFRFDAFLDDYEPAAPKEYEFLQALTEAMEGADAAQMAEALLHHYKAYGRGDMARYMAFYLLPSGELKGIETFRHREWDDLIGYAVQKEKLLRNTVNFIEGRQANNVLLTGARGTGKSTAVKALVYKFHKEGLRLVQVERGQMKKLPPLMEHLSAIKSKKFILFFDDLSFDEDEKEYKYLKSVIDGGIIPQPDNVVIYATSNRRHLLKETWRDRRDDLDEVYRDDSQNESISLSDRFGLIIHYAAPTQDEYLQIIDHELRKAGVALEAHELRILGLRWEMEHSGRNGRIARQFVRWYLGNQT